MKMKHPSQRVSKAQCKKPAKKNNSKLRFDVNCSRDFMFFEGISCFSKRFLFLFFTRFYIFLRDFMLEKFV